MCNQPLAHRACRFALTSVGQGKVTVRVSLCGSVAKKQIISTEYIHTNQLFDYFTNQLKYAREMIHEVSILR